MKKNFGVLVFSLLICFVIFSLGTNAATKNGTVYKNVIKNGNTVYCSIPTGLYKIDLNSGKKVNLAKTSYSENGFDHMVLKGKYLYFDDVYPTTSKIWRVNTVSGKKQLLASDKKLKLSGKSYSDNYYSFIVIGKKIYCKVSYAYVNKKEKDGSFKMVMGLNGKNKKTTKAKIKIKEKESNASGYSIHCTQHDQYYLYTPTKAYYLDTYNFD